MGVMQELFDEFELFAKKGDFEIRTPYIVFGKELKPDFIVFEIYFTEGHSGDMDSCIYLDFTPENNRLTKALFPEFREYALETETE